MCESIIEGASRRRPDRPRLYPLRLACIHRRARSVSSNRSRIRLVVDGHGRSWTVVLAMSVSSPSGLFRSISCGFVVLAIPSLPARSRAVTRRKTRGGRFAPTFHGNWPVFGTSAILVHCPFSEPDHSRTTLLLDRFLSVALQRRISVSRLFGSGAGS